MLPFGREPVEVGRHAGGTHGRHADASLGDLFGEGFRETAHVGLGGGVERHAREGYPDRVGGHV